MAYYCYILECADGTFYTGFTTDPQRRLQAHNLGRGARYTKTRRPVRLVYVETQPDHASALRREMAIKAMPRKRKEALIHPKIASRGKIRAPKHGQEITPDMIDLSDFPKPDFFAIAPGRVNLLGEHVDYNAGIVLPAAIDRAVRLAVRHRDDRQVHIRALDLSEEVVFDLDHTAEKRDIHGAPLPGWAHYPAGVAHVLQEAGLRVTGMEAWMTSNVPIGAGLSSSAAVELGFAVTWQALGGWALDALNLARLAQRAEVHYVGLNCGLMDQFASACGVAGHVLYLDTRSLDWGTLPLPPHTVIIIADSTLRRSLVTSGYNDRHAACLEAVAILRDHLSGIQALRDVTPDQFEQFAGYLPEGIRIRARHVVEECARVEQALALLQNQDGEAFGRLMIAGHASLRDLYEVSLPEIDCLVDLAIKHPGCLGARITGAGFGGCTVNLVREAYAADFVDYLHTRYLEETGKDASVYLCRASQGAHISQALE